MVTAIRFVRACVALKDDFYYRHFTRFNLFAPLVDVFLANGDRYNLLNSAVLELMEYIRKENIKVWRGGGDGWGVCEGEGTTWSGCCM